MVRAIAFGFRNLLSLEGRDRRRVFWPYWFAVAAIWAAVLFLVLAPALDSGPSSIAGLLALIAVNFVMFFLLFAACVRRLHDSGVGKRPAVIIFSAWVMSALLLIPMSQSEGFGTALAGPNLLETALIVMFLPAALVATFGSYWMLYLLLRNGTAGPNQFGPQPPKRINEAKSAP